MIIQKGLMALIVTIWGTKCMAHSQTFTIDMGTINVKVIDAASSEDLSYVMPAHCQGTTLSIQRSGTLVSISHTGKRCESGAEITIPVRTDTDTNVKLGAGVVHMTDPANGLSKLSEVRLTVNAGLIRSSKVPISRLGNYVGQQGILHNGIRSGRSLSVNVNAGTISY